MKDTDGTGRPACYSVRLPCGRTVRKRMADVGPAALAVVEHLGGDAWLLRAVAKARPAWAKADSATLRVVPARRIPSGEER